MEKKDRLFALLYILVGYGFVYCMTTVTGRTPMTLFTVAYAAVVLAYCFCLGLKPARESGFWLGVVLLTGLPYDFYTAMPFLQMLVLIITAAYWTLSVSGRLMDNGRTSSFVAFDVWNALFLVPFSNFFSIFRVLFGGRTEASRTEAAHASDTKQSVGNGFSGILLGLCIAIPLLAVIIPLLAGADEGFAKLISCSGFFLRENLLFTFMRMLLSIPVTLYLFGLVYGSLHGQNTNRIKPEAVRQSKEHIRIFPCTAVLTTVTVVCLVYLLFISLQGRYLFSAFTGTLPEEFTYAAYARRGFFELCAVSVLNILILLFVNLFAKKRSWEHAGLLAGNIILSVLTLLLIATAMSKMGMYITVFGLTVKRVLTMVFMLWMVIVFAGVIVRQKKCFPLIRLCTLTGAVLFTLLCILPVERCIDACNALF